jgi:hypothetical protein
MLDLSPPDALPRREPGRTLTENDAIDIWIARWLHVRRKDILARYGCDPRRLYDIWEGVRFPASRKKALDAFETRFPDQLRFTDTSPHRRIPRPGPVEGQPMLFDHLPERGRRK